MIYCLEDDEGIRDIEVYTLRSTGYEAEGFADGKSFLEAVRKNPPKLVILDIMLPGEDGLDILRRLKTAAETRDIPVIMATAKGSEYDKIKGLDLGADDYLAKPFGMMEMVSRVRAVLRRAAPPSEARALKSGGLSMNLDEHRVYAAGESVPLTLKEYEMLRMMLEHPGIVFTRDQLLSDIWGMDYDGETRTVDVHMRTLRQKLGECGDLIETVRGVGYRLVTK
ncbi:MAG: response regulator transcription factor [Clostridiales bacterium]|nr:response regulator transcription factor [Clostridiales bacterium]